MEQHPPEKKTLSLQLMMREKLTINIKSENKPEPKYRVTETN